ncbi:hypothetical protein BS17DRAFT_780184 [Gyrodon lividus]|nr:hypothetical protein BS17DRAFT_780184 [Gyrodon lividus]
MIVVDDSDWKQATQNNVAGQASGDSGFTNTAPPGASLGLYASSYTAPPPPPPPPYNYYNPYSSYRPPLPTVIAVEYRPSPVARFWKAFALAIVLYFGLVGAAHTLINMAAGGIYWDDGAVGAPLPEDGTIVRSIDSLNWTSYHARPEWVSRYSRGAETSFILPVDSEELYFISRGSYQQGKIQVKQASDVEQGSVKVDVRVAYNHDRALRRATVCKLQKNGNKNGVGVFTPTPTLSFFTHTDQLRFEVAFTFPVPSSGHTAVRVKGFSTSTGNFAHEIGDLWRTMMFDNIKLHGSNSPIRVGSITLAKGLLTSSNSQISGHFNTSDSLSLQTSNGAIDVTASLLSTRERTTKLDMKTSNSAIKSKVSLSTYSNSGGKFDVKAHSSNGMIDLKYDDSPLNAHLTSEAKTSNSHAIVKMHPAFEGTFEVSSSNIGPAVQDRRASDPSGRGRQRIVNQNKTGNKISGSVYWDGPDGTKGHTRSSCTVRTSNAPATLAF